MRAFPALAMVVVAATLTANASASPPARLVLAAEPGSCPAAEQVAHELRELLPGTRVSIDPGQEADVAAAVRDRGAVFRVSVGAESRTFDDPARQCQERARVAAVYVALTVDPPSVGGLLGAETEPRSPRVPASSPPARPPPREPVRLRYCLELGGRFGMTMADAEGLPLGGGGSVRFVAAWPDVALTLASGLLASSELVLDHGAQAEETRALLDASLRGSFASSFASVHAEIGPVASVLRVDGSGLPAATSETRLDAGVRGASAVRFWPGQRFGTWIGVELLLWPRPYVLEVEPVGRVGSTASLWAMLQTGIILGL